MNGEEMNSEGGAILDNSTVDLILILQEYMDSLVPPRSEEMQAMEAHAEEIDFPIIGPAVGNLCYQIARMSGAKHIFELGSGYGYSTAWFAKAVEENGGGTVHHVDRDEELSNRAKEYLQRLGYAGVVQYHVGEAIQILSQMPDSFDLIFNDIDKEQYLDSLPVIMSKVRSGGVLIADNMLLGGQILFEGGDRHAEVESVRGFTHYVTSDPDWIVSLVYIRDGVLIAYKKQ
jgi:caffeoyl-CoA O-methyltransferase